MPESFMPEQSIAPPTENQTPALFWWILATCVVLALVPTLWTRFDLEVAALFTGTTPAIEAANWSWVDWINQYVPAVFRVLLLLALGGWIISKTTKQAMHLRLILSFTVLAGILGPGAVVNWGFKEHWQRARPYQVQHFGGTQQFTRAAVITDQCDNNCSFVSGHVACGFFFISLMLVDRKRRIVWALTGLAAGWIIGFARMADSAHWLSDVLWAAPITLMSSWLAWKALLWSRKGYANNPSLTVG
jgi:lipid A 4'-phosphatase